MPASLVFPARKKSMPLFRYACLRYCGSRLHDTKTIAAMTGVAYRMDIGQSADEPGLPQLDETTVDLAERSADEPVGLLYNQGDIGGGVVAIAKLKHQGGAWVHVMHGI